MNEFGAGPAAILHYGPHMYNIHPSIYIGKLDLCAAAAARINNNIKYIHVICIVRRADEHQLLAPQERGNKIDSLAARRSASFCFPK